MFDAIIIDTNAFEAKSFDFIGMTNSSIPSLFESLKKNNIKILTHEILLGEMKAHLTKWDDNIDKAKKSLTRNRTLLEYFGINVEKVFEKIDYVKNSNEMEKRIDEYFKDAEILEYSNPKNILKKYFNVEPPFDDKKHGKKYEFPDAFVIESVIDYIEKNKCTLLVVAHDDGWKDALSTYDSVIIADDINETLRMINNSEEINNVFQQISSAIEKKLHVCLKDANYLVNDYDVSDYVEVNSIDIVNYSNDIIPVKDADEELIIQAKVNCLISGETTILDTDNSIWDPETKTYILKEFSQMEFEDGRASAEFEVVVKRTPEDGYIVENTRLVSDRSILVTLDENKVTCFNISIDTDLSAERDDALENYYRH